MTVKPSVIRSRSGHICIDLDRQIVCIGEHVLACESISLVGEGVHIVLECDEDVDVVLRTKICEYQFDNGLSVAFVGKHSGELAVLHALYPTLRIDSSVEVPNLDNAVLPILTYLLGQSEGNFLKMFIGEPGTSGKELPIIVLLRHLKKYDSNENKTVLSVLEFARKRVVSSYFDAQQLGHIIQNFSDHPSDFIQQFLFPPEFETACKQYLLFFSDFLKQVGISAHTDITHEAKSILFSVSPDDPSAMSKEEFLARVQKALSIYLQLPDHPEIQNYMMTAHTMSPEVHQLLSQVQFLQSQLNLSLAQAKAQQSLIEGQGRMLALMESLTTGVLTQALKSDPTQPKPDRDRERVLGGAVNLKPLDVKVAEIHIPNIYRYLKSVMVEPIPDSNEHFVLDSTSTEEPMPLPSPEEYQKGEAPKNKTQPT